MFLFCFKVDENAVNADKIGNLLHPLLLRQKKDVEAWLKEDEFRKADKMWYETLPDCNCTYYEYFEKLPEFSAKLRHLKLYKLSWKDLDPYYLMDPASVRIARLIQQLNVLPNGDFSVMDMCAAPGGKSLIFLDQILNRNMINIDESNNNCKLISNEMGFKRINNLKQVINSFVPNEIQTKHLVLTNVDGKLLGLAMPNKYDFVLLDAPCSSDRHLLLQSQIQKDNKDNKMDMNWSIKSVKNIAKTQYGLLRSALETVKIGGYIIYSSCTMNKIENDHLIEQILKKRKGKIKIIDNISLNVGERTEYGWQILPDISTFYEGPLYFCVLRRID